MDAIRDVLKVLFQENRSEDVIDNLLFRRSNACCSLSMPKDIFLRQLLHIESARTLDQAAIVYHVFLDSWSNEDKKEHDLQFAEQQSIYNVLLHFVQYKLRLHHNVPVCKYQELLSWHTMTRDLGEDLFVTSFLASVDLKHGNERQSFEWSNCIGHDAAELNLMFEQEMLDVHAHLNGSSLNFDLNWLCLMNKVFGHEKEFAKFDKLKIFPSANYNLKQNQKPLYVKIMIAASIRLYLWLKLKNESWANEICRDIDIKQILKCRTLLETFTCVQPVQDSIDILCYGKARQFSDSNNLKKQIPDYAISGDNHSLFAVLGGERRFLYDNFGQIFSRKLNIQIHEQLFYVYLLIKEELRRELVQINSSIGFANFADYQERKNEFFQNHYVYQQLLPLLSVGSFVSGHCDNRYMEVRIAPKDEALKYLKAISKDDAFIIDSVFDKKHIISKKNFHYIIHFIKYEENANFMSDDLKGFCLTPRHAQLRKSIERQARSLMVFRKSGHNALNRIVGIDAANSEIFCRPEVFAQVFRYLKSPVDDTYRSKDILDLGQTFHVGEDFYDIVDGLRAVDEVLKYMQFRNGSRLGHVLVLGTDVFEYYTCRNFRINATKQVILDNVAWLYVQAERIGANSQILSYLEELFDSFFTKIFPKELLSQGMYINTYYQSWLLRGDSPECYAFETDNIFELSNSVDEALDCWLRVSLNHKQEVDEARANPKARKLYTYYHYCKQVRAIGSEGEVLRIKPEYRSIFVETVFAIQQKLLSNIERLHIGIECNPSSNFKIGEMKRYDEHPILKFYNHGLNTSFPKHSICVSINTDDAGVFDTSIEREYSLMALALEKHKVIGTKNNPREIMEWLNNIRIMTKEQKFGRD